MEGLIFGILRYTCSTESSDLQSLKILESADRPAKDPDFQLTKNST